jgi:MFS family permease
MVTVPPPSGRWQRVAVTAVFFVHGFVFASWTAHIPHIKEHLGLGDGTLGLALLGAPVGSVGAMVLAAYLLPRLGSRRLVRIALVGYCATGPLVGLAGSLAALFVALVAWGAFYGTLDVSMNTQAVAVERRAGRPQMTGFHGTWSIGAFAGAGAGALGVAAGVSLSTQLLLGAAPGLLIAGWLTTRMVEDTRRSGPNPAVRGAHHRAVRRAVIILGAIAFADMLCEGAAADWSAVFFRTSVHAAVGVAGLGYAVYSLAMVAFRLSGNQLLQRVRPEQLLPGLALVASVGFTAGLVIDSTVSALIGFACLGAGCASVIPTVLGAAGRITGVNSGSAVAAVAAFGWAGFVCGPPLIGQLASATSLRLALGLLPALTLLVAVTTSRARALRRTDGVDRPTG